MASFTHERKEPTFGCSGGRIVRAVARTGTNRTGGRQRRLCGFQGERSGSLSQKAEVDGDRSEPSFPRFQISGFVFD